VPRGSGPWVPADRRTTPHLLGPHPSHMWGVSEWSGASV